MDFPAPGGPIINELHANYPGATPQPMSKPKAYSYLRFSTPEQSKGNSFQRQTDLSRQYADRNGLALDEAFTFRDLGMSAFRGKNAREGALGVFLAAVDSGRVGPGSYLLVENLDRLSRDKVHNAYVQFSALLQRDINVVTLQDGKLYTRASLDENFADLLISLTTMFRAHEESATKSKRLSAAWKAKRQSAQEGRKLTGRCPAWVTLDRPKNVFVADKAKAGVIRRIFKMALDGHGKSNIARRLNVEGVPSFGRADGWHQSYIQKILQSEAVYGAFQPMRLDTREGKRKRVPDGAVIEDYFPIIVDRPTFEKVKRGRTAMRIASGPKGANFSNLFTGIAICGRCGAAMHYVNKGAGGRGGTYLVCSATRRSVSNCNAPAWRYRPIEEFLINGLREVNYTELFPDWAVAGSVDTHLS
jgi:DNA invertase Pin-like site-specific DNA recombinase